MNIKKPTPKYRGLCAFSTQIGSSEENMLGINLEKFQKVAKFTFWNALRELPQCSEGLKIKSFL